MNDNLQEIIEKLVYKTTEENGWAPQNKLGQYLARMGRSVRELGYEKMSNFFQDHPERFEVEKDEHGLPVVRLLGEAPEGASEVLDTMNNYQQMQRPFHHNTFHRPNPGYNNYRDPYPQPYPQRGNFYQGYHNPAPYQGGGFRNRQPQPPYGYQRGPEQPSLFRWAFFPDREEWLQMLADLAREQSWSYDNVDPEHPNTGLFDYLRDTFRRLQLEGRVLESRAEGIALFNTGLVDREEGRPIYAVFGPNPNRNRQPWLFQEFFLSSAPLIAASRAEAQQNANEIVDETDDNDPYNVTPLAIGEEPPHFAN